MAIKKIKPGQWAVNSGGDLFVIVEGDDHTSGMLNDFKTDPAKLAHFESLMQQHGAANAYFQYNHIPVPIQVLESKNEN